MTVTVPHDGSRLHPGPRPGSVTPGAGPWASR